MLPVALAGGGKTLVAIVPAEVSALRCSLVQAEVGPVKFPSTTQENETNSTSLEHKVPPWGIFLPI